MLLHRVEGLRSNRGRAWASNKGWFFVRFGGDIYLFHISIGPIDFTLEKKD